MTMLKWERKCSSVAVTFFKKAHEDTSGRRFKTFEAARAIREGSGWRVDRCSAVGPCWMPWEPITSEVLPTLSAAKKAVKAYADTVAT